jgi:probable F420-dependent oxidoreductase
MKEQDVTTAPRGFRFAVLVKNVLNRQEWWAKAQRIQELGYSTLLMPDHITRHLAGMPALMAAADATTTLRVSSFVNANDYRNPVLLAKEAVTLDVLSDGRFDLALGTGWYTPDYEMLGIRLDAPADRVSRLAESVELIKRLWTEDKVDHAGRWYSVRGATVMPRPVQRPHPPILIGANGPKMLRLAAQHADIVSITGASSAADMDKRVALVRAAAGERFAAVQLNMTSDVSVTDEPSPLYEAAAAKTKMAVSDMADCPFFLYGPLDSLRQQILERRERYGVTYYPVSEAAMEAFAPLARDLASLSP